MDTKPIPKPSRKQAALCIGIAAALIASFVLVVLVNARSAYAATTDTDGVYYQLYEPSKQHSKISHLRVDGRSTYCMEINSEFKSGIKVTAKDAVSVMGQAYVTRIALMQDYVFSVGWLNDTQRYFISQTLNWEALNPGDYSDGLFVDCGVSQNDQANIKSDARVYAAKYADSYIGGGTYYDAGNNQDLAEFWIDRHTVGSVKLKKASSNPGATIGNDRYSFAGAIYTIYNSDGKAVGTLTCDANGNSNTVSDLWAGEFGNYTVKETTAPKGYKLDSTVYKVHITTDGQTITVNAEDAPILGKIELTKSSANPSVSDGNSCYSLAGAIYGVYASADNAKADKSRVATITTDAAGYGKAENLPLKLYYVHEVAPPKSYAIDDTIYTADITQSNTTVKVTSKDFPKNDPVGVLLQKADADTGLPYPESKPSDFEGAEFTFKYYDGIYSTVSQAEGSGHLMRTWVMKTDKDGFTALDPSLQVSGDALYYNAGGDPCIPIGTFTVQETKAPKGYLLSTPQLPNTCRLFQITPDGSTSEFIYAYNAPEVREQIVRGDVNVVKYQEDETPSLNTPSGQKTPEANVTFDFYASRDYSGTKPNDGAVPAFSLTTDEDGVASSWATNQVVIAWPDGTYTTRPRTPNDAGSVPYDTYLVVQHNSPRGYSLADPFLIYVGENAKTHTYIVGNMPITSAIRIEKVDAETGLRVPYPATWQILNADTNEVVKMTIHYPTTQVLDEFTSDEDGNLTLPDMLKEGDYMLKEVTAPAANGLGYLLNDVQVKFSVDGYHNWDDPIVVTFEDAPAMGEIKLTKSDAVGGEVVPGATYDIVAAEDIVTLDGTVRAKAGDIVDTVSTGEDGMATSKPLYLGKYTVHETKTAPGYALDSTGYDVTLAYKDQVTEVVTESLAVEDEPTTLYVEKTDVESGDALQGVKFTLTDGKDYSQEEVTDETGFASWDKLLPGTYTLKETETLPGYVISDKEWTVVVDSDGLIEGDAYFKVEAQNDFTKLTVTKTAADTKDALKGATLQIVNDKGEVEAEWETDGKPFEIDRLPEGNYFLHELKAPDGYQVAPDVYFSVKGTADVQTVDMCDSPIPAPKLDQTGNDMTALYALIGVLGIIALGAGGYVVFNLTRKRDEDADEGKDED